MSALEENTARQWEREGVGRHHLNRAVTKGLPEKGTFENAELEGQIGKKHVTLWGKAPPAEGTARAEEGWGNSKTMWLEQSEQRREGQEPRLARWSGGRW